jgi:hypothetical protein
LDVAFAAGEAPGPVTENAEREVGAIMGGGWRVEVAKT